MLKTLRGGGSFLGFECEGDVVLLVGLQFVRGKLEGLHVRPLLQLEGDGRLLAPGSARGGPHAGGLAADPGQDGRLAGHLPGPELPPGVGGAGDPSVGVGRVVTPVTGVSTPAGIS